MHSIPGLQLPILNPLSHVLLTLYSRFFAPNAFSNPSTERDFNDSLNNDGALDAYAETVVWRLNGVHAMVRYVFSFHFGGFAHTEKV